MSLTVDYVDNRLHRTQGREVMEETGNFGSVGYPEEEFADFVSGSLLFFLSVKCFALRFG